MDIEKAKMLFPNVLCELLLFEEKAGYVIIKPRMFLGTENFAEVSRIVREAKGEYISAGKDSHFRIPLLQQTEKPHETQKQAPALHFKVTKLTVGLGTTVQHGEKEWTKQSYNLEVEVNSDSVDVVERARLEAEQIVNQWLHEPPLPSIDVPDIDLAELDKCPWTTYQTKEPAKPNQAAWVKNPEEFKDWKDAPNMLFTLVKALKKSPDKKLTLGTMTYELSGKDEMKNHFISRKPTNGN